MTTILVPTDFSSTANNALTYAIQFATQYQFEITLFHAVSLATIGSANSVHAVDNGERLLADAEFNMMDKINTLNKEYPKMNFHHVVKVGFLLETLQEVCKEINPVAVIMGITGSGSTMDKMIGSNAVNAMNSLQHAVIIVPNQCVFKPIEKISFACDLKQVVTSTPMVAIRTFSKLFNAEVHILNVDYNNRNFTPSTSDELRVLDGMLEDTKHSFHFIENENVQDAISDFVEKKNMDMVIMIPKKHNLWEGLFKKSQSKEMAYHSHVPVLALHVS